MAVNTSDPHVVSFLLRAGLFPASQQVQRQLAAACERPPGGTDAVLEVSQARWGTETQGPDDVFVVLSRASVTLVWMLKSRGLFKAPEPRAREISLSGYRDVAEDDEVFDHSVIFLAADEDDEFLLSWTDASERQRMFWAIFCAHAGRYAQWGLQLDPAEYVADFDRYYAQLVAEGPSDRMELNAWVEQEFGEFDITNALGFAAEWRGCVLADAAGAAPSKRVMRLGFPHPWIDAGREAERVLLRLGEELFDEGLLGPPYDERTFAVDEELSSGDAGPARLLALMTLAGLGHALRDPRTTEWVTAARGGIGVVPPAIFSDHLREMWAEIEPLPAVDDRPPEEIPIWKDPDVRAITTGEDDRVVYAVDALPDADRAQVIRFFDATQELGLEPDAQPLIHACLLGVSVYEGLSVAASVGWSKQVLYSVSNMTYDVWEHHRRAHEATALAQWVIATMEANGWGADGRMTALGQHHSYMFGVLVGTGAGVVVIDPVTGRASAPTGDEARQAAAAGCF